MSPYNPIFIASFINYERYGATHFISLTDPAQCVKSFGNMRETVWWIISHCKSNAYQAWIISIFLWKSGLPTLACIYCDVGKVSWAIRLALSFYKPGHTGTSLRWRHNGRDSVSNLQPHDCLLNLLFRRRSKNTWKLRVTGLCAGNSPVTGEFPSQMASNAENVSIWWRHHDIFVIWL